MTVSNIRTHRSTSSSSPTSGSSPSPTESGATECSPASARAAATLATVDGRRRGQLVAGIEQRFERLAGDEAHRVQGRDLRRVTGVGEAHRGDRRPPRTHDGVLHPGLAQDVAVARRCEPRRCHLHDDRLVGVELHEVGQARLAADQGAQAGHPAAGAPGVDQPREPRLQPTRIALDPVAWHLDTL